LFLDRGQMVEHVEPGCLKRHCQTSFAIRYAALMSLRWLLRLTQCCVEMVTVEDIMNERRPRPQPLSRLCAPARFC
jgi:hypothetical protein